MKKSKFKTGAGLIKCVGLPDDDDKEYEDIIKELKPLWRKWTKRYADLK